MSTVALFDERGVAERYARHRGSTDEDFVDELAVLLAACGPAVVDIGAGIGAPAEALRRRGLDVVAVEPSAAMVAEGRRIHPDVRFLRSFGEQLPLRSGSRDSAVLLYVLHHSSEPVEVLREAGRVVRPGGPVVVASGNGDCPRQRFFAGYFPTLVPDLPDGADIAFYGLIAGLEVRETRTAQHWLYPNRIIDEDYVAMVETEIFAPLRSLNELEFRRGLNRLRADLGRSIPPSTITLAVLESCGPAR